MFGFGLIRRLTLRILWLLLVGCFLIYGFCGLMDVLFRFALGLTKYLVCCVG